MPDNRWFEFSYMKITSSSRKEHFNRNKREIEQTHQHEENKYEILQKIILN